METPSFDPGLTQQFIAPLRRAINHDGSFNVHRRGSTWRDVHPYLHLINMPWPGFLAIVFAAYLAVNTLFALIYASLGVEHLQGADESLPFAHFLNAFFFSAHTLTTVGYGSLSPKGVAANIVAAMEAMVGLMGFALATGLLYGRVSRPSARIGFSPKMVVAPFQDGLSLQFRIVNRRINVLMELEATMLLMTVDGPPGKLKRNYAPLKLERHRVYFLPLTWTIVHPIDHNSPLRGLSPRDLERLQAEVLILVKAFDDTFSQTVHARNSYRFDEVIWSAKFKPAFEFDPGGDIVLNLHDVGATVSAPLPAESPVQPA
jgi:inward rectifier potassium channel